MDIFESLENLNISEECFNDIINIVESIINEGQKQIRKPYKQQLPLLIDRAIEKEYSNPGSKEAEDATKEAVNAYEKSHPGRPYNYELKYNIKDIANYNKAKDKQERAKKIGLIKVEKNPSNKKTIMVKKYPNGKSPIESYPLQSEVLTQAMKSVKGLHNYPKEIPTQSEINKE